jgi:tetratricopeptide (TPR) repeat protein
VAKASTDANALFTQALDHAKTGQRDRALQLLARAHTLDVRHVGIRNALGVLTLEAGNASGAVALLKPLARELPNAAPIQLNLGNALVAAGRAADAIAPLKRAASLDDTNAIVWYGYARALQTAGRVDEADAAYVRVLAINPAHPDARANRAAALNFLDRYAEAEAEAQHVLRASPTDAGAHFNRAMALLAQGQWAEGWAEYEWRRHTSLLDGQRRTWSAPTWDGNAVRGQTVVVHAEQGYGDTLQFVRYLPVLRARGVRVVLQCPSTLVRLLRVSALADDIVAFGEPLPSHDAQVALTSLPYALQLHDHAGVMGSGEPYLRVPDDDQAALFAWNEAPAPRVGLVWAGSSTHVNDMHRSCGFAACAPLLNVPGVTWVNLQVRDAATPAPKVPRGTQWHDHAPSLGDFADTARALRSLDLVVTVDSAVAHLAGALGVPCWLLLPRRGLDWRWAAETSAARWYHSVRTFRQAVPGDWSSTVTAVARALANRPSPLGASSADVA